MLTTMYYYNFYRPYMIDTLDSNLIKTPKKQRVTKNPEPDSSEKAQILLNKSLKKDVVSYAKDVSNSVVGIKNAARDVGRDMEQLNKNTHRYDFDTAKSFIGDSLEEFENKYNSAINFLSSQTHSRELNLLSEKMNEEVRANVYRLSQLGISFTEEGQMHFNREAFTQSDNSALSKGIGENLHLFNKIYSDANDTLRVPLTDHMKFKNLGYYYNYKYGGLESDTFKIIESGMLVDRVV